MPYAKNVPTMAEDNYDENSLENESVSYEDETSEGPHDERPIIININTEGPE